MQALYQEIIQIQELFILKAPGACGLKYNEPSRIKTAKDNKRKKLTKIECNRSHSRQEEISILTRYEVVVKLSMRKWEN